MSSRTHGDLEPDRAAQREAAPEARLAGASRARPAAPDRQPRHRAARCPRSHDEEDQEAPGRRRGRVRHRHQRRRGDGGQDDHHHDPRHARDRGRLAEGGHGHQGRLQERPEEGARQDQGASVADEGSARGQARGGALRADPRQGPCDVEAVEGRPGGHDRRQGQHVDHRGHQEGQDRPQDPRRVLRHRPRVRDLQVLRDQPGGLRERREADRGDHDARARPRAHVLHDQRLHEGHRRLLARRGHEGQQEGRGEAADRLWPQERARGPVRVGDALLLRREAAEEEVPEAPRGDRRGGQGLDDADAAPPTPTPATPTPTSATAPVPTTAAPAAPAWDTEAVAF